MVDDLGFSPNITIEESIGIFMWKLNKMHDINVQSLSDNKNKGMVRLKYFTKGSFVHPYSLNIFPLYTIQWYKFHVSPKLYIHVGVFNHISNGLVQKMVDDLGSNFFPQISLLRKY